MEITNNQQLVDYIKHNKKIKFLLFWGHRQARGNRVDKSCLSQWFPAPFIIGDIYYFTAEHYMMAEKARLFNDDAVLAKVLNAQSPGEAKQLGRQVNNFNEGIWIEKRFDIVCQANFAKFTQNSELGQFLLNTGHKILVEASPVDKIWGVGLAADDHDIYQPNNWKGLNLLGYALMKVRKNMIDQQRNHE